MATTIGVAGAAGGGGGGAELAAGNGDVPSLAGSALPLVAVSFTSGNAAPRDSDDAGFPEAVASWAGTAVSLVVGVAGSLLAGTGSVLAGAGATGSLTSGSAAPRDRDEPEETAAGSLAGAGAVLAGAGASFAGSTALEGAAAWTGSAGGGIGAAALDGSGALGGTISLAGSTLATSVTAGAAGWIGAASWTGSAALAGAVPLAASAGPGVLTGAADDSLAGSPDGTILVATRGVTAAGPSAFALATADGFLSLAGRVDGRTRVTLAGAPGLRRTIPLPSDRGD